MRRLWGVLAVCALGGLIFFIYVRLNTAEADPLSDFTVWTPSSAELQREVEAVPKHASPAADAAARRDKFAELMTRRFRRHNDGMAIRVRFRNDQMIELLCPARMEPWNMDRIALDVWREAGADLKGRFDMNLFRTYIGTPPIKVGELRSQDGQPDKAQIRYYGMAAANKSGNRKGGGSGGNASSQ